MKNYLNAFLIGILLLATFSKCSKSNIDPTVDGDSDSTILTPAAPEFLFAGLQYTGKYSNNHWRAVAVIKDSIIQLSPNMTSDAIGIVSVQNDVYVAGKQKNAANETFVSYWKNGKLNRLSEGKPGNLATAIHTDGKNVYIAGKVRDVQVEPTIYMWTNGKRERKACCLAMTGIYAIDTYDGKVVAAGNFANLATMWKDGSAIALAPQGSGAEYIKVVNKEVYVLGWENSSQLPNAVSVWKDDVEVFKNQIGFNIINVKGFMEGKDYYYAVNYLDDNSKKRTAIYKNKQLLYKLGGNNEATITGIKFHKGKVYVVGNLFLSNGGVQAMFWEDGKAKADFLKGKPIFINDFFIK